MILLQKCSGDESGQKEMLSCCKVAQAAIQSLTAFVDWINVTYIFQGGGMLLEMLCVMLGDNSLQLAAADCLLTITNRKVGSNAMLLAYDHNICK